VLVAVPEDVKLIVLVEDEPSVVGDTDNEANVAASALGTTAMRTGTRPTTDAAPTMPERLSALSLLDMFSFQVFNRGCFCGGEAKALALFEDWHPPPRPRPQPARPPQRYEKVADIARRVWHLTSGAWQHLLEMRLGTD
jgi:hypothetical protein